jgi:UDP:flavonoid glycosyltransferase YjiC (YdhE family)
VLLACSLGGMGHLDPLVPVARSLARGGHEITLLVPPSLERQAALTGLPHVVGDQPPQAVVDAIWERVRAGPPEAVTGLIDRELFAERCTAAMLDTARRLQPDLVVREPCEYASAVVACEAGVPQVQIGISLARIEWDVLEMVAPIIGPGIAAAVRAAPYLSRFPPSLDPSPWPDTRRYLTPAAVAKALPDWWPADQRPLVYVTFGSVTRHLPEAAGVYRVALAAAAELPARVLVTGWKAERRGHVRVEAWVPQADVLPHAAVVVCHGGTSTTLGALAAGVPLVVCPLFADQAANGRLVEAAGCGITLGPDTPSALRTLTQEDVEPLRAAVERVLGDPAYRRAAERVAAELRALPPLAVPEGLGADDGLAGGI